MLSSGAARPSGRARAVTWGQAATNTHASAPRDTPVRAARSCFVAIMTSIGRLTPGRDRPAARLRQRRREDGWQRAPSVTIARFRGGSPRCRFRARPFDYVSPPHVPDPPTGGTTVKYVLLIYDDEKIWES